MSQPEIYSQAKIKFHWHQDCSDSAPYPIALTAALAPPMLRRANDEITSWPGYQPTPLHSLDLLAQQNGLGKIFYKDEGQRFGLGSFKALGGAYAVLCVLQDELKNKLGHIPASAELASGQLKSQTEKITVVTATDGNHGRSVAWGAQRFNCRCLIYIHAEVSRYRQQAMEQLGATVIRIDGDYDASVRAAAAAAAANNWIVVSDTSYPGYVDIPRQVMAGYSVMIEEVLSQLPTAIAITHVFVQGGVGGLAAAVIAALWCRQGISRPTITIVEPQLADCLYQSGLNGRPTAVTIEAETIMAGLSCGEVSLLAWQIVSRGCDAFMTIPDNLVEPTMLLLARHRPPIVAGESAVAGLAGCLAAVNRKTIAEQLKLNRDSVVLVLGTEGATDPGIYQQIVGETVPAECMKLIENTPS